MSVEAMTWAFEVPVGGNAKLVLLGIANHASPDGGAAWPSLDTLARYAHCHRNTVRSNIRALIRDGWVIEDGHSAKGTMRFRLPLKGGTNSVPPGGQGGYNWAPEGGTKTAGGDTTRAVPEPSLEPPFSEPPSSGGGGDQPSLDSTVEELVDRFLPFYRGEVEQARGEPLRQFTVADRKATRRGVQLHSDPHEVAAVLRWGLGDHRWYADKIHTPVKFWEAYPKMRPRWQAAVRGQAKAAEIAARNGDSNGDGPTTARNTCYLHERLVTFDEGSCPVCAADHVAAA